MTWTDLFAMAHGKHILIVDDYPDALEIWVLYLTSFGYRVSTAADGQSAITLAQRLLPDLIVLDLELPRIPGWEVAKQLRRHPRTHDIPLIAATGYSHERQLTLARDAGFDSVLVKPVEPEALLDEIERFLDSEPPISQPIHFGRDQAHENG